MSDAPLVAMLIAIIEACHSNLLEKHRHQFHYNLKSPTASQTMTKPPRPTKTASSRPDPLSAHDAAPLHQEDDPMQLFRDAVGDVKPVINDRVGNTGPPPPPRPRQFELDEKAVMHDAMMDDRDPDTLDTGEHLSWARNGVQKRVIRKLRNGYYAVQAELDLHGMTVNEAREAMREFIAEATNARGSCCVRIIHGKGRKTLTESPVLKPFTASYLRQRKDVLAYCSANRNHGGTGAVYVLLRAAPDP